jgi:phage terminase small subunit
MGNLTPKQEKFCQKYIETGNASEAYRQSYNAGNMKMETVNRNAKKLLDSNKTATRIEEIQRDTIKRHNITVDTLLNHLETIRKRTMQDTAFDAKEANKAIMSQAKLLGLDKQIIEVTTGAEMIERMKEAKKNATS